MSCSRPAASSSARPHSISWDDLRFENTDGLAARILSRKTTAAEGFIETVRLAGELVGGRAFSRGHDLERLYRDVQGALLLRDGDRALGIHAEHLPDVVVWNPWEEKCAALADMPKDGFRHMLCVEAARAATPLTIVAGESWWGRQTLVAL